jgi:methylthioribose-1-phosphate isomerase
MIHGRLRMVIATDASVGILSKDVDLVIIGADRISEAGDMSNKTGSLAAVLASKEVTHGSAIVVCISEADKIAPTGTAK